MIAVNWLKSGENTKQFTKLVDVLQKVFSDAGSIPAVSTKKNPGRNVWIFYWIPLSSIERSFSPVRSIIFLSASETVRFTASAI